ncbi:MAG: hypothetical protein M3N16_06685 [Actinomycetota bacterium]|nr:hypothetical protein [Actinomycetota bacterium]
MPSVLLGALAALAASALFSAGLVLQALDTRGVHPRHSLHLSLIASLMCRRRWLLGTGLTLLGFPFHVVALLLAPLTVVQPALSAGLLVLLAVAARTSEEEVGASEVGGVVAIAAGVVGITLAAPERAPLEGEVAALVLALAVLAALTLVPYAVARLRVGGKRPVGALATFSAGAAYAFAGLTTKLISDLLAEGNWPAAIGWLAATAVVSGLGFLSQLTALQRRTAAQVGPVIYVMPVLVPVLLAPLVAGEGWSSTPLGGTVLAASLLVVCVGTALVAASSAVHTLVRPGRAAG